MSFFMDDSFMRKGNYLWDKIVFDEFFESLEDFKNSDESENKEVNFTQFLIELKSAKREFLEEIKELPMIMNCRVKGNSGSHFGGEQCAKFVNLVRRASEKYLSSLPGDNYEQGHIGYVVKKVRDKARKDEQYAWNFEQKAKQEYLTTGKDITLDILKNSGYNF